jgi:two-component system nitrogen regulation response regulator NtrX
MREVQKTIGLVADSDATVLITGETGTGKEVVARTIHRVGARSSGPFMALNCAAIPPDLLESELFGHVKGAFTGAIIERKGAFREASGGTLFLDEIGDMDLAMQAKILRAIQERVVTPVGGKPQKVDVRIVAATHRDLEQWVKQGRFREDLFYRLNVVPIRVPPLRDRREDIPLLARHFMARGAEAGRIHPREFGEDALAALQAYTWPGNVRQLRNVIDWLLIMAPGDGDEAVHADMLPNEITAIAPTVVKWDKGSEIMTLPLRDAREVFEREYLLAQVTRFGGNISRTAAFVGMERSALHRKLKSLGVFGNDRPLRVGT